MTWLRLMRTWLNAVPATDGGKPQIAIQGLDGTTIHLDAPADAIGATVCYPVQPFQAAN